MFSEALAFTPEEQFPCHDAWFPDQETYVIQF